MTFLNSAFSQAVSHPDINNPEDQENQSKNQSDSAADGIDSLTLEFKDNPFASFIRELESLIERDPKEAFRLLQMVVSDKLFDKKQQMELLSEKLDAVFELLRDEPATENDLQKTESQPPLLTSRIQFTKGAWGLPVSASPAVTAGAEKAIPSVPATRPALQAFPT